MNRITERNKMTEEFKFRKFNTQENRTKLKSLKKSDLKIIAPFVKTHRMAIFTTIFWTAINALCAIFPPLILKTIVDEYILSGNKPAIARYFIILIALYVLIFIARYRQQFMVSVTTQTIVSDLREQLFKKVLDLPISYYGEHKRGELLSVVINDVNTLSHAISNEIIHFVSDMISMIGIGIIMFRLDWQLAVVLISIFPLILLSVQKIRQKLKRSQIEIRRKIAQMNANVEENISGIRVAQSLVCEDRNVKDFTKITKQTFKLRMKAVRLFGLMNAIVTLGTFIGMAIMLSFGGYRFIIGAITIGVLLAFIQYSIAFIGPVSDFMNLYNIIIEAGAALFHIREMLVIPEEMKDPETPIQVSSEIRGEIEFRNVSFSYTEESFIKDFHLKISPGDKIGIVGETGAGKTTLINLMMRLYDVKKGQILLDGHDIRNFRVKDLRSIFSAVSQDVFLFSDTIMNNIRFGKPDASDEEVIQAAKFANVDKFIQSLPDGYNTKLGERGVGLSGGQKQLIAYARMVLARPKVAILDEATSNIDSYTENLIQKNMEEILSHCTVIVIAHRFATLKSVQKIILFKNGKIIATGTHQELYESNDYYRTLCNTQHFA